MVIQALTTRVLTLKINQGTIFGTHEKLMFSLFDVKFFFISKYLGQTSSEQYNFEIIAFPRIIAPLWCEKKKKITPGYYLMKYINCHSLLYLETHNFTIYVLRLRVYS